MKKKRRGDPIFDISLAWLIRSPLERFFNWLVTNPQDTSEKNPASRAQASPASQERSNPESRQ